MSFDIIDKVCIITGGASGLGALMTKAFLGEGAKHVTILDVAEEAGVTLASELQSKYGKQSVVFIKCDVTDEKQLFNGFQTVVDEYGSIDVVINNAGIMNDSPKMYKLSIQLNVTALITSTLKAVEIMRKDKGGKGGTIINISSIVGLYQSHLLPVYFATKSAVLQFSLCMGSEGQYKRTGVRVLTICFGITNTPLISMEKCQAFDDVTTNELSIGLKLAPSQKPESAVRGLVEAYKRGDSGTVWLIAHDKEAEDITDNITEGYKIISRGVQP